MSSVGTWGIKKIFRTYRKWKLYLNLIRMSLRNFERRWKADLDCTTPCTAGLVVQCLIFSSPNDPIFALNHANIDRLWALWQSYGHHGESHYPDSGEPYGHNLHEPMWPWDGGNTGVVTRQDIWNLIPRTVDDARPAHIIDCKGLGYGYVNWNRVKEILDALMDGWRKANFRLPTQISNDDILAIHGTSFGWNTGTELAKSTAFGLRLIEPNKVGNGRGFETNLIKVLKEGIPQVTPQMPKGGPYLLKIEIAEIAHWIDSGMPE